MGAEALDLVNPDRDGERRDRDGSSEAEPVVVARLAGAQEAGPWLQDSYDAEDSHRGVAGAACDPGLR